MKNQKFGFEFEFYGMTRKAAATVIANHFGTRVEDLYGYNKKYGVRDAQGRVWKVVYDSSIITFDDDKKCEMVTPICCYDDIETIQALVRDLRSAGAKVNESCSIHVHIDAAPYTAKSLKNVANIMAAKEDILCEALAVNHSRLSSYCKKADTKFIASINSMAPRTVADVQRIWYEGDDGSYQHYHQSRYRLLNLHSVFQKGTVEFRCFNGTTHAGRAKAYIQFCLAVSHMALTQRSASPVRTTSTNKKYTFRTWLLRLGLIGDEFKTARRFLLENLEGNSAWRNA